MGNVSVTVDSRENAGSQHRRHVTVTYSNSYATGGDSYSASDFGLSSVDSIDPIGAPGGYVPDIEESNEKVLAYESGASGTALDEVDSGTDLSSTSFEAIALGY